MLFMGPFFHLGVFMPCEDPKGLPGGWEEGRTLEHADATALLFDHVLIAPPASVTMSSLARLLEDSNQELHTTERQEDSVLDTRAQPLLAKHSHRLRLLASRGLTNSCALAANHMEAALLSPV